MRDKIINSFDIWITAQDYKSKLRLKNVDNISLEGIARLRELILELAVRGKLVSQNPTDEPASILLKKIEREKERLVEEGKIKKQKTLQDITEDERPFVLPKTWELVRLGNIGFTQTGGTPDKSNNLYFGNDIPFIKPGDIYTTYVDYSNEGLTKLGAEQLGRVAASMSILMVCIGTIGKCNIIDRPCTFNQQINSITPHLDIGKYLLISMRADYFQKKLWDKSSSTTIAILNKGKWENTLIPLPPLAEQHRIVAKVTELMALCDELEQQETNHLKSHQLLVETLLGTLTKAADAKEFQAAWTRLAQHFDDLFTTEDSIDQLKQTILQLAVMGKLVPQDPKDEPASVLLKRIEIEKERLIKKDLIKPEKPLPAISEGEIPYRLPFGWQWCRMKDLCPNISSGSTPPQEYFKESGIPYLKVYNIRAQQIDFEYQEQFVDEKYHRTKLSRSILRPGDVIMNIVGPPLGKVAIIPDSYPEWNCNQAITFFQPLEKSVNKWIYTFLLAGTFLNYIELIGTAGQDNISVTKSKMIMVPLPPIPEQFRIVKKVDELFALCDRLKEGISESQKVVNLMANSIVEHVA